ncbi:hypothetical protein HMPREF9541_00388 [Escherichia coli MS 116-1]|nr:hypothetical protein HMPREF9541_00388 [Escherichia coli MS 116-1]ESE03174.1 hypothetical protein HMPREF1616_03470 [Escherichia coli 908658]
MVFSFSSIVNYRRRCNCWKNGHQRIVDNSFVGRIRRSRRIRHGIRGQMPDATLARLIWPTRANVQVWYVG